MKAARAGFVLGCLLLALVAGVWLSGIFLSMLLDLRLAGFADYLKYLDAVLHPERFNAGYARRLAASAGKIKLAGALGFGLPLLAWLFLLFAALKPQKRALHGDARFASGGDIGAKGLFDDTPNGVVVGKFNGKLMKLSGQQFVILAAPTRSGKGVGVVIPNLLEYQESVVVLDIKQENYELTSGWRKSQGQEVFLFNPFAEDRRTHRWNPLSYVSRDPAFRISDLQSIAAMLYPDVSDDQKFWVSQARNAFMAFSMYLFERFQHQSDQGIAENQLQFPSLGAVYQLSSGDGSQIKTFLFGLSKSPFLSTQTRTAFNNLLSQADETFASILGTFKEPLNPWINPVLDAATSANDFWLTDVRRKKMTIYIGIQPNKLAEARLIVNLFFSQLINVNTKELPQNNPALKHQCLLLMDEFTSIGKVEIIANAVSYMAGYNIRLLPIIQSMAQLDATYGKDVSRTLITNHALQIVYAPREQQDANDYSEMLGTTTLRKRNRSTSHGQQGSVSYSEVEERRALMLPQELKAMGNEKEIVLFEGLAHPVMAQKIKYYEDKQFTRRLLPKVEIPMVQIPGMEVAKRMSAAAVTAVALAGLVACAQPNQGNAGAGAQPMDAKPQQQPVPTDRPIQEPAGHTLYDEGIKPYPPGSPVLSPSQVQDNILKVIDQLKHNEDISPEFLSRVTGLKLQDRGDRNFGVHGKTTEDWDYAFTITTALENLTHGNFNFLLWVSGKDDLENAPSCTLPLEPFLDALRTRGFKPEESYWPMRDRTQWQASNSDMVLTVNYYYKTAQPEINKRCLLQVEVTFHHGANVE